MKAGGRYMSNSRRGRGPATTIWTQRTGQRATAFIAGMACRCICIGIPSIVDEDDPANRYADTPEGRIFIKTTRWEIASDEDENPIIISGPAKKAAEQLMTMEV